MTRQSLWHDRFVNLLAALAVATSVAALAGALVAGASIRSSLEDLALVRLGATDVAVSTATSFNARIGEAMQASAPNVIRNTTALIATRGTASSPGTGRTVAGVDDTFWPFHGVRPVVLEGRSATISPGLAAELDVEAGAPLILRMSGPPGIPLGTLLGRRDIGGNEMRLTVSRTLAADRMGELSLAPRPGPVLAVFVPLSLMQQALDMSARANLVLVQQASRPEVAALPQMGAIERAWMAAAVLADHGVSLRRVPGDRVMALAGRSGLIAPDIAARVLATLARAGRPGVPALAYVATGIRVGDRAVPYSTVTAIDVDAYNRLSVPSGPPAPGTGPLGAGDQVVRGSLDVRVGTKGSRVTRFSVQAPAGSPRPPLSAGSDDASGPVEPSTDGTVWLNEWAANRLDARLGDTVSLDYLVWTDDGGFEERTASFALQAVAPMMRIGGDRTLTPDYPGLSNAAHLAAWNPPFPVEVSRIGREDEAYWDQWRTAPKAIVPLEVGQSLWGTRFGNVSSIRFALQDADAVTAAVRSELSEEVAIVPVRAGALAAAAGATSIGTSFLAFSVFLVIPALLIAYQCFALGLERRAREAGVLAAMGFTEADIRRVFVREALVVAAIGGLVGAACAIGYAELIMSGLRTWWVDAVGTNALRVYLDPAALAVGVLGATAAAFAALWMAARALSRRPPRSLITGASSPDAAPSASRLPAFAAVLLLVVAGLLAARSTTGAIGVDIGFAAGASGLVAGLLLVRAALHARRRTTGSRAISNGIWQLGCTHAAWRPARTLVTMSLMAFGTFALVSSIALRPDVTAASLERAGGVGGFVLMVESAVPLMSDPNTADGRLRLGLEGRPSLDGVTIARARLHTGDDASRLTPYQPRNPRILGVNPAEMEGRFTFAGGSPAAAWARLDMPLEDGAIPAMADQATLANVLNLKVGDLFEIAPNGATPVRFRIVAALAGSVLQSELVIGESAFVGLFPRDEGYRVWLVDAPEARAADVRAVIEDRLAGFGVDVVDTRERLAAYHRAAEAYLSAFEVLGGLGLLLGALGVGAVLARNLLERRREWGLLRAVGYSPRHFGTLVLAESLTLVAGGVALGVAAAALAVAPAMVERGQAPPLGTLAAVLAAVVLSGLGASLAALRLAADASVSGAIQNE